MLDKGSASDLEAKLRASRTLEQGIDLYRFQRISIDESSLVVIEGPHKGQEVPLERDLFYIGRADFCDLALPLDKHISGVHCELRVQSDGIRLVDRESRNGCYVGGQRVFEGLLVPDVPMKLGNTVCVLRVHSGKSDINVRYADDTGLLVGQHPRMREIFALLSRLAPRDIPILLTGETGTGKTSIALALHKQSKRQGGFVTVNCGALSPSLIESELFGYEKGAFTGAAGRHKGFFEQADGGTLFLDEIAELPLELQPKLLDVLERKRLRRLGGTEEIAVDFRLVSATHRSLRTHIAEGLFREDLFYRIAVMELHVPALRDRREDLPLLVNYLLHRLDTERLVRVSPAALRELQEYHWPGNLRELRNVLERSVLLLEGNHLEVDDLLMPLSALPLSAPSLMSPKKAASLAPEKVAVSAVESMKTQLADAEREIIRVALETLDWNVSKAAQMLEVSRSWLHGRIKSYGLQRPLEEEASIRS